MSTRTRSPSPPQRRPARVVICGDLDCGRESVVPSMMTAAEDLRNRLTVIEDDTAIEFQLGASATMTRLSVILSDDLPAQTHANVFVVVFSVDSTASLEHCDRWRRCCTSSASPTAPVVLIGAHTERRADPDIEESFKRKFGRTMISYEEGARVAARTGAVTFLELSSAAGDGSPARLFEALKTAVMAPSSFIVPIKIPRSIVVSAEADDENSLGLSGDLQDTRVVTILWCDPSAMVELMAAQLRKEKFAGVVRVGTSSELGWWLKRYGRSVFWRLRVITNRDRANDGGDLAARRAVAVTRDFQASLEGSFPLIPVLVFCRRVAEAQQSLTGLSAGVKVSSDPAAVNDMCKPVVPF